MAPLCCWVIRDQCRVSSQGRVHNGALVACLWYQCRETLEPEQEISRKISLLIHSISLLEWAKGVTFIYLSIFLNYRYNSAKSSILHWIILILACGNSLKLHIFEFSQFRPDLIAPSTSALGGLVRGVRRFLQPWYQVLLNFKVSSTSKYQVLEILHQVPSIKYKYFTWPQPWYWASKDSCAYFWKYSITCETVPCSTLI